MIMGLFKRAASVSSRVLQDSAPRYVGPLVGRSVGWSVGPVFTFLAFFSFLSLLLLPKCSGDLLQHCPCPPTRNWGSRVTSLVPNEPKLKSLAHFI